MKISRRTFTAGLAIGAMGLGLAGCAASSPLDPKNPVAVTIWNYYNGDQLTAFEALVDEFNSTIGYEKGIVVTSVSQGAVDTVASSLVDAVNGKIGAEKVPSAAAIYPDTAYVLNKSEAIVSLDPYFTADELAEFVPEFLDSGRLTDGGSLYILPVSKSTEVFMANKTDWAAFEEACGISIDSIDSYETLAAAAEAYYVWTDEQTPDVANDGKALYGRDSIANYIFVSAAQLGHPLFTVDADGKVIADLDRDAFKTMWDNYYIPFINGYFAASARYRSEDMKTGAILAATGSSSGVSYMPTAVTDANDETHDVELAVKRSLAFKDSEPLLVQQGAGYVLMKTSEAEQLGAVEFLKWFTDGAQNLAFSLSSGYSSAKLDGNDADRIAGEYTADSAKSQNMLTALLVSADAFVLGQTYSAPAFAGSKEIRDALDDALTSVSTNDRAAVVEAMAAGSTREEAVAPYCTDEYFDAWFAATCDTVNGLLE